MNDSLQDVSSVEKQDNLASKQAFDDLPWYAVHVFKHKQKEIENFLKDRDIESFIPMSYVDVLDKTEHIRRVLKPVVYNLIFIKKTKSEREMRLAFNDVPYEMSVIRKNIGEQAYYEIPAKQMYEFKIMCNPELEANKYISEDDAKLKIGTEVTVKFGPMKGLSGKLVRQSKKYYLLKEIPGMGVMMKISRWCCVPITD